MHHFSWEHEQQEANIRRYSKIQSLGIAIVPISFSLRRCIIKLLLLLLAIAVGKLVHALGSLCLLSSFAFNYFLGVFAHSTVEDPTGKAWGQTINEPLRRF
jgi:hypothetical protein